MESRAFSDDATSIVILRPAALPQAGRRITPAAVWRARDVERDLLFCGTIDAVSGSEVRTQRACYSHTNSSAPEAALSAAARALRNSAAAAKMAHRHPRPKPRHSHERPQTREPLGIELVFWHQG